MIPSPRLGHDRTWYWRGWHIRYIYLRPQSPEHNLTPLLLVHGFGASSGHWRHNLVHWSQQHPVYALDLLGFGRSQKAGAPYTPLFFAELLADFWQTFLQRPAILVGNSLGSLVGLITAHRYPDRIKGLVLVNLPDASVLSAASTPASSRPNPLLSWVKRWGTSGLTAIFTSPLVINPLLAIVRSPGVLYPALKNAYADPLRVDEELKALIREPALEPHAALALRCLTRTMGQIAPNDRARSILPTLQTPLLLIWGKNDRLVPPFLASRCAALNPRLQLVELDQAGHCPQDECSDRVNAIVLDWINQTFPVTPVPSLHF